MNERVYFRPSDEELTQLCQSVFDPVTNPTVIGDRNQWGRFYYSMAGCPDINILFVCLRTRNLIKYFDLKPHHIDILLKGMPFNVRILSVYRYCDTLTHEQIERGLSAPHALLRWVAANNPCCTESQRVRYNLLHGGEINVRAWHE